LSSRLEQFFLHRNGPLLAVLRPSRHHFSSYLSDRFSRNSSRSIGELINPELNGRFRAQSRRWANQLLDFRYRPFADIRSI
jgi:hypothetical protein